LIITHSNDKNNGWLQQKNNSPQKIIEAWLILQLSVYLKIAPTDIDIKENLAQYGLDSAVAVSLIGELGKWLNCELEPTLFWEYPSIDSIAQYLAQEFHALALFPLKSPSCIAQEV
ncbi:MAG: acyl carrier protein, partial [Microcystaceae cyanobacterium]